ncbi:hypothetical protein FIM84_02665 [Helicobacter pylori]|nr:hypothetical protein FIM83_04345 [Helicobacter pylori]TPH35885.1 hypothetical protein FIM84_02665 [Helicobacter pylori]
MFGQVQACNIKTPNPHKNNCLLFKKDFSNTLSPLILILQSVTQIFKVLSNNWVKNKKNKTIKTLFKRSTRD